MAIHNVYNQTPKRIYTNKPFVMGMVYTNADMSTGVCRAVANLDLEASNTATRVRQSVSNKAIVSNAETNELVYKFFNKLVKFEGFITEGAYKLDHFISLSDLVTDTLPENKLGFSVIDEASGNTYNMYNQIIYNDTILEWTNSGFNNVNNQFLASNFSQIKIYALIMDDGDIPHCVNSNDYSFSFFGVIANESNVLYKGVIKLYYHNAAQQVLIEVINPYTVSPEDVENYGPNMVSTNPFVYRDYLYYNNNVETYTEYGGYTDTVTDITTVQVYDASVGALPHTRNFTANVVKGFNKNALDDIYVRPYVALPKSNYYATVSTSVVRNNQTLEAYYDFTRDKFDFSGVIQQGKGIEETATKAFEFSYSNFFDMNSTTENIKSEIGMSVLGLGVASPIEFTNLEIKVPEMNFTSAPSNVSYQISLDAYETAKQLNVSGYGSPAYTDFYVHNLLVPTLNLNISEQTFNIPINMISGDASNPTLLQLDNEVTEEIKVFGFSKGARLSNTMSISNFAKRDIFKKTFSADDFEQITIGNDNTCTLTVEVTEKESINQSSAECRTVRKTGDNYFFSTETFSINKNNNGTVTYMVTLAYEFTSINEPGTGNPYDSEDTFELIIDIDREDNYVYSNVKPVVGLSTHLALYRTAGNAIITYPLFEFDTEKFLSGDNFVYGSVNYVPNLSSPYSLFSSVTPYNGNTPIREIRAPYSFDTLSRYANDFVSPISSFRYTFSSPMFIFNVINNSSSILSDYTWAIQSVSHLGAVEHNLSIPISKQAFKETSFDNVPSVIFKVAIFDANVHGNSLSYNDNNIVEKTSAPIQINLAADSIVSFDSLRAEYDISNRPNRIGLHLGHYVIYNSSYNDNTLYYSYPNDISYFPSNYAITLNNPIVHIHPHQNNLVVFTTDDVYLIHSGNVPSTISQAGDEVPFSVNLIQSGISLSEANINTVRSIGKDVFFIDSSNNGYLLKTNKYVSNAADTYLIKITTQIDDLLNEPYRYVYNRLASYNQEVSPEQTYTLKSSHSPVFYNFINESVTTDEYKLLVYDSLDKITLNVIDGDTFKITENADSAITYRLAGINTPEDTSVKERLGNAATARLQSYFDTAIQRHFKVLLFIPLNDVGETITDLYGRTLVYLVIQNAVVDGANYGTFINAALLRQGLAHLQYEDYSAAFTAMYDGVLMNFHSIMEHDYAFAKRFNIGVNNNLNYTSYDFSQFYSDLKPLVDNMKNSKFVYATNNNIYIIQSVLLYNGDGFTIIYKYNIETKTWITYDFESAIFPYEYAADNSKLGFKLYCSNCYKNLLPKATTLTFNAGYRDTNQIVYQQFQTKLPVLSNEVYSKPINIYFDSGNQSLALMNDKLFREVKITLGDSQNDALNIDYAINLYIDGKLVAPNVHYKGKQVDSTGFKTITFFTPARGRIPRVEFTIDCESDLNILQYAIVYMQLNAK